MAHHDDTWIRTGALLAGLGVAGYYGARWLTAAPPAAATLPPSRPTAEPRPKAAISAAPRHLPIIDVGPVTSPDQVEAPAAGSLPRHFDPIFERHRGSIPIEFIRALAMRESGMNPSARDTAAWGLLQIVEVVRQAFNQAHGTRHARAQLLDPEVNVPIAAWLLQRIVDGYQRHHADVANLRTDWRNPRFVELVVFGWNAGMSEAAGVGRVVEYLKRRGHRAIDLDLVHEHAQAAGASRHHGEESGAAQMVRHVAEEAARMAQHAHQAQTPQHSVRDDVQPEQGPCEHRPGELVRGQRNDASGHDHAEVRR